MKRTLLLLAIGLLLLPGSLAQSCGQPDDSQLIYRISAPTNAHAETWNGAGGYTEEICYNTVFGVLYPASGTEHVCAPVAGNISGNNGVLQLSAVTNAHVEMYGLPNYPVPVCYGNLDCDFVLAPALCTTAIPGSVCLGSASAVTNAHISRNCGDYSLQICCASALSVPGEPFMLSLSVDPGTIVEADPLTIAQVSLTNLDSVNPRTVDLAVEFIDSLGADVRGGDYIQNGINVGPSATHVEDLMAWIDPTTLPVDTYRITAEATDSLTSERLGTQSAFLVVIRDRGTPVPEIGAILLPLIGVSVIVVLFLASEKESITGLLKGKKRKPRKGLKAKHQRKKKR